MDVDMYTQFNIILFGGVKYRQKILTLKIENRLIELLYQIARENNFQIIECNTDKDHIHILVNCKPQHYVPDLIQKMKGIISRKLMEENREILSKKL